MEPRRIRRVRKPTAWQLLVLRWHRWIEDTLEKAVCCGADPAALADADARFSMGGKQASSVFSIRSMSVYRDDSDFEEDDDNREILSDTESESTDDHLSSSRVASIDMEGRYSFDDYDEPETRASVSSEYIPFDDEHQHDTDGDAVERARNAVNDESGADCEDEESKERALAHAHAMAHRFHFNCVLAELLMTSHPVVWWSE
jgi:hypothetical protein